MSHFCIDRLNEASCIRVLDGALVVVHSRRLHPMLLNKRSLIVDCSLVTPDSSSRLKAIPIDFHSLENKTSGHLVTANQMRTPLYCTFGQMHPLKE